VLPGACRLTNESHVHELGPGVDHGSVLSHPESLAAIKRALTEMLREQQRQQLHAAAASAGSSSSASRSRGSSTSSTSSRGGSTGGGEGAPQPAVGAAQAEVQVLVQRVEVLGLEAGAVQEAAGGQQEAGE
jgi:hypothetical protein